MKERPILFSAPMVRAILEGRKTQTRRICKNLEWVETNGAVYLGKPVPDYWRYYDKTGSMEFDFQNDMGLLLKQCPYGEPGDGLWVKETWRTAVQWDALAPSALPIADDVLAGVHIDYLADGKKTQHGKTRVSIHMPKWASRIFLEITGVRCERLNDIGEEDCYSEGIERLKLPDLLSAIARRASAIARYRALWESINGPGSWAENPWVWVIEFSVDSAPCKEES